VNADESRTPVSKTASTPPGDQQTRGDGRLRALANVRAAQDSGPALGALPATPSNLRPLSLPSLGAHPKIKDVIYRELRERIVFGNIAPGDRLIEADLAARFGVSKTPVREALLTLEAEGLVIVRPHRGAVVSRLSVAEWTDLIYLRDVLEVGALNEIMAGMTNAHFVNADAALADMTAACGAQDYLTYRRAQRRLHAIILGVPGHPSLPEAAVQLNDRLDRYGRMLVTRDPAHWAGDLEMNRRRLELIRERDTASYAAMIRGRHANATPLIEQLAGESDGAPREGAARGARRRAQT
jgi:DNA-binding GntR family transcriptional regulator